MSELLKTWKDWLLAAGIGAVLLVVLGGGVGWNWYRAGLQSTIYARAGIQMTQWECFIGMKPPQKAILVEEHQP